jgi:hypothetical protein
MHSRHPSPSCVDWPSVCNHPVGCKAMLDMYSHIYQYRNEDIKLISACLKVHVSLVLGVPLKELRDEGVKIICSSTPPVTEQDDRTGTRGTCRLVVKIK